MAAVNFHFDAWGGKDETYYGARAGTDDRICAQICEKLGIPRFDVAHVLEGGAIESNGDRSCLTTKNCLITRDRKRDAKQWETILHEQLGFENILWLDGVDFDADDTQGHIDNLTKAWQRLLNRAGIDDLRRHDLRRTLASTMADLGANQAQIQMMLGHRSPQSARAYIHPDLESLRETVGTATNLLSKE